MYNSYSLYIAEFHENAGTLKRGGLSYEAENKQNDSSIAFRDADLNDDTLRSHGGTGFR